MFKTTTPYDIDKDVVETDALRKSIEKIILKNANNIRKTNTMIMTPAAVKSVILGVHDDDFLEKVDDRQKRSKIIDDNIRLKTYLAGTEDLTGAEVKNLIDQSSIGDPGQKAQLHFRIATRPFLQEAKKITTILEDALSYAKQLNIKESFDQKYRQAILAVTAGTFLYGMYYIIQKRYTSKQKQKRYTRPKK